MIDAHVHYWDPARFAYAWLDALPELRRPFLPEDLDHGRHPVDRVVFVEADRRSDEAAAEVAWVAQLRDPRVAGIVAHAPLERGAAVRAQLEALREQPLVVGVRRLLQSEDEAFLRSEMLAEGVGLLAGLGLAFDACVTHEQLPALTALAARCPDVTIVLDHLGKPDGRLDPWRANLAALARHPHVYCKLSGAAGIDSRPFLEHALEAFGPERCMAGSDWPVASLMTTTERWFDLLLRTLEPAGQDERSAVLTGTATRAYRLV